MTIAKPHTIFALLLTLGVSGAIANAAVAADGTSDKTSAARQAATADPNDSSDGLVLPELDKPAGTAKKSNSASANQDKSGANSDRPVAPPRSGSVARPDATSSVKRTSATTDPRSASNDDRDPATGASPNHVSRPAPRNSQASASYPDGSYPNRGAVQNGAYMAPANGSSKYAPNYPPNYSQSPTSRPASAMYYDRSMPSQRYANGMAQNAPPQSSYSQSYPEYRPSMRVANRMNEPTPADHAGQPPDVGNAGPPESVPPGTQMDEFGGPEGSCSDCMGGSCNSDGCSSGGCQRWPNEHGGWFGAAEVLVLRPTSSENIAYQKEVSSTDDVSSQVDTAVQRDWGYNGSFRTYIGWRSCDCCDEVRFTYWNYGAGTHQLSGAVPEDQTTQYTGQLEINALNPGDRLQANNSLLMNTYDIDYGKCLTYGCCDPCGCGCPPWGLKYYVGIRIADVERGDASQVTDSEGTITSQSFINTKFVGAGPRVGLEGRRFFGCADQFSLFARTNFALLLGQFDINERSTNSDSSAGTFVNQQYLDSHDRVIPMAEIELGANWQVNCHWNISAGYLWQAWWDMGMFEQGANTFQEPIDTSNILGLDGFFARFEYAF